MEKLQQIIRDTLGITPAVALSEKTTLKEIPGWDSMNAVNLEVALEAAYGRAPDSFELGDDTTLQSLFEQLQG